MVNYYQTLKVSPKASRAEIKSAYRRLARKLHPDANRGSEQTARAFAAIAEAYEVLGNPEERARYDKLLLDARFNGYAARDSVFASSNAHARRWRQLIYEKRYNEIVDRMIAEEHRESTEMQKFLFPTVALFVSSLAVGIFKPAVFVNSTIIGKIIFISLFFAGLIHIFGRFREALDHFTYDDGEIHESIFEDASAPTRRFSRFFVIAFLVGGAIGFFGSGLVVGHYIDLSSSAIPVTLGERISAESVFYPPIFVMFVDFVHAIVLRAEG